MDKEKQALIEMVGLIAGLAHPLVASVFQLIRISRDLSEETQQQLMERIDKAQASVPEWK